MPSNNQAELSLKWCFNIIEALTSTGVKYAYISPGSRSTPLTYALAHHPGIECHSVLDERSAAFMALGSGKATGIPALFVSTSGTAVANALPAVIEARMSGTPMIVLSADRPPSARATGSPQTIDQLKLFGDYPVFFFDTGEPIDNKDDFLRMTRLGVQAYQEATLKKGPVHINFPFRKPLEPEKKHIESCLNLKKNGASVTEDTNIIPDPLPVVIQSPPRPLPDSIIDLIRSSERALVIAGPELHDIVPRNRRMTGKPFKFGSGTDSNEKQQPDKSFSGWCQRCDIPVLAETGGFPGSILLHPLLFRRLFPGSYAPIIQPEAPVEEASGQLEETVNATRDTGRTPDPVKSVSFRSPYRKSEHPQAKELDNQPDDVVTSSESTCESPVVSGQKTVLMPRTIRDYTYKPSVSPLSHLISQASGPDKTAHDLSVGYNKPAKPSEKSESHEVETDSENHHSEIPKRFIPDTSMSPLKQLINQVAKEKILKEKATTTEETSPDTSTYPSSTPANKPGIGKPSESPSAGKMDASTDRFKIPASSPDQQKPEVPKIKPVHEPDKWEPIDMETPDLIIRIGGEPVHSETRTALENWRSVPQIIFDQYEDYFDASLSASHRLPQPASEYNWDFDVLSENEQEASEQKAEEERKNSESKNRTVNESAFNLKWWSSSKKKELAKASKPKKKGPAKRPELAFTKYKDQWVSKVRKLEVDQIKALNIERRLTDCHVFFELLPLVSDLYDVQIYLSNSLVVRDYPMYSPKGTVRSLPVLTNRGASGIDGVTSSAIGASIATGKPTVLFTGDLAFLHDANALNNLKKRNPMLKIVILNNHGGSIFRMLPFKEHDEIFREFVETPQNVDISFLAKSHGIPYRCVEKMDQLPLYWEELRSEQLGIIECKTDRFASMKLRYK